MTRFSHASPVHPPDVQSSSLRSHPFILSSLHPSAFPLNHSHTPTSTPARPAPPHPTQSFSQSHSFFPLLTSIATNSTTTSVPPSFLLNYGCLLLFLSSPPIPTSSHLYFLSAFPLLCIDGLFHVHCTLLSSVHFFRLFIQPKCLQISVKVFSPSVCVCVCVCVCTCMCAPPHYIRSLPS